MADADKRAHYAHQIDDSRDDYWDPDFLALMARRWQLTEVRRALDVGCGAGHWGQTLLPLMAPDAVLHGVDPDDAWLEQARQRASARQHSARCTFLQGHVEALPYEDAAFDLVTCQTLLIHVPDVEAALREMVRVTKPGGLVAAIEPNNRSGFTVFDNVDTELELEQRLALYRFELFRQQGKQALGHGDDSVGDLLPMHFAQAGLAQITVHLSDKAHAFVPPYPHDAQREAHEATSVPMPWPREIAQRCFLAGGGTPAELDPTWALIESLHDQKLAAVRAGRLYRAGGIICYLVSARKPAPDPPPS